LKTNFVLVDFENVQTKDLNLLLGGPFKIKIFLGATQVKIPLDVAQSLQAFGADAEYIRIDGNGSNALDFHIAYYIGSLASGNPGAYFHIISEDRGFDPLIKHIKTRKIFCQRATSISDIPMVKLSNTTVLTDKVDAIINNLIRRAAGKPRSEKTLANSIKHMFLNQLSDDEASHLIGQCVKRGVVVVHEGKVSYALPSEIEHTRESIENVT
jgi:PIN domain